VAESRESGEFGEEGEVVVDGLAEADAGIEHDPLGRDTGGEGSVASVGEPVGDLGDHVVVVHRIAHGAGRGGLLVHQDQRVGRCGDGCHPRIAESGDVVDPRCSGRQRLLRDVGLRGVDRE